MHPALLGALGELAAGAYNSRAGCPGMFTN